MLSYEIRNFFAYVISRAVITTVTNFIMYLISGEKSDWVVEGSSNAV